MSTEFQDRVQQTLGDTFQIERELAPGGMSRLFLAAERSLDRSSGNREDAKLELRAAIGAFQKLGAAGDARSTRELLEA